MAEIGASDVTSGVTKTKSLISDDTKQKIKELRILMESDDKVKNMRQEDAYLLRFLYFADFDVEAAFKKMQELYDFFLMYPEWFSSKSPEELRDVFEEGSRIMGSGHDRDGRHIFFCKLGKIDPDGTTMQDSSLMDQTYLELIMDEVETMEKGICLVMDLKGYSWRLFKWFSPTNMRISSKIMDLYPLKTQKIHVVNTSKLLNVTIKLLWPFLSKRQKENVFFHFDDWPSLHEHIAPKFLPPEYNGTGSLDEESCLKVLYANSSRIADQLKHFRRR